MVSGPEGVEYEEWVGGQVGTGASATVGWVHWTVGDTFKIRDVYNLHSEKG